jgi:hypothetical protein
MSKTMGWYMDLENLHREAKCDDKCHFCDMEFYSGEHTHGIDKKKDIAS